MIVAGIGCRSGIGEAEVHAAIDAALLQTARAGATLSLIAIPAAKANETGIAAAAAARGVPLMLIPQCALAAANERTLTHSTHAMAAMNLNSVAEAAALAGAGPAARLLAPRIAMGPVTCALAEGDSKQ